MDGLGNSSLNRTPDTENFATNSQAAAGATATSTTRAITDLSEFLDKHTVDGIDNAFVRNFVKTGKMLTPPKEVAKWCLAEGEPRLFRQVMALMNSRPNGAGVPPYLDIDSDVAAQTLAEAVIGCPSLSQCIFVVDLDELDRHDLNLVAKAISDNTDMCQIELHGSGLDTRGLFDSLAKVPTLRFSWDSISADDAKAACEDMARLVNCRVDIDSFEVEMASNPPAEMGSVITGLARQQRLTRLSIEPLGAANQVEVCALVQKSHILEQLKFSGFTEVVILAMALVSNDSIQDLDLQLADNAEPGPILEALQSSQSVLKLNIGCRSIHEGQLALLVQRNPYLQSVVIGTEQMRPAEGDEDSPSLDTALGQNTTLHSFALDVAYEPWNESAVATRMRQNQLDAKRFTPAFILPGAMKIAQANTGLPDVGHPIASQVNTLSSRKQVASASLVTSKTYTTAVDDRAAELGQELLKLLIADRVTDAVQFIVTAYEAQAPIDAQVIKSAAQGDKVFDLLWDAMISRREPTLLRAFEAAVADLGVLKNRLIEIYDVWLDELDAAASLQPDDPGPSLRTQRSWSEWSRIAPFVCAGLYLSPRAIESCADEEPFRWLVSSMQGGRGDVEVVDLPAMLAPAPAHPPATKPLVAAGSRLPPTVWLFAGYNIVPSDPEQKAAMQHDVLTWCIANNNPPLLGAMVTSFGMPSFSFDCALMDVKSFTTALGPCPGLHLTLTSVNDKAVPQIEACHAALAQVDKLEMTIDCSEDGLTRLTAALAKALASNPHLKLTLNVARSLNAKPTLRLVQAYGDRVRIKTHD